MKAKAAPGGASAATAVPVAAAAAASKPNKAARVTKVILAHPENLQKKKMSTTQKPSSPPELQRPPPTQPRRMTTATATTPTEQPDSIATETRVIQALRRLFKVLSDVQFNSEVEIERQRRRQCPAPKKQQHHVAEKNNDTNKIGSAIGNRNRNHVSTATTAAAAANAATTTAVATKTATTASPSQRQQQKNAIDKGNLDDGSEQKKPPPLENDNNNEGSRIENNSTSLVVAATTPATAEMCRRLRDADQTRLHVPPPNLAANTSSNKKKRDQPSTTTDNGKSSGGINNDSGSPDPSRKKRRITTPKDMTPLVAQQTGTGRAGVLVATGPSPLPQQREQQQALPARFPPRLTTAMAVEAATIAAAVSASTPGHGDEAATDADGGGRRLDYKEKWAMRYQELADFKENYGHLNVPPPHKDKTFMTLYWWIILQKTEWRKFNKGMKTRIGAKQIKRLILIGLGTCDGPADKHARSPSVIPTAGWNARFEQLLQFKKEHGHIDVPEKKGEGKTDLRDLARWANKQRKNFANRQHKAAHGTKKDLYSGTMSDLQVTKLASIGFRFTNKIMDWDTRFQLLEQYKTLHGNTRVPKAYSGFSNLGDWVMGLRQRYKSNKLSPERIARLEAIGFEWKLRDRRPKLRQQEEDSPQQV